ncbi:ABC transporter permease [Tannockella kyphosi]|uniref:ABC transporter permease n=1 Tax=Tannockella kyphosi TaxID=2899121 RepID=UPI0020134315|nr:ABC transporter permease [Tannockella kyphosi]
MAKYILKRIVYALATIFLLIFVTFLMMQLLPGDPFTGDKAISEVTKQILMEKYGLDKSVLEQFWIYFKNVLQGDLGVSTQTGREVTRIISESFPYSFELGMRALLIATVGGITLGSYAAIRRGRMGDTVAMLISVVGVSVPSFIVAALLQYFVALKLRTIGINIFPISGWTTEFSKWLPSIALSFGSMATISRLMRTSMLDVLSSDYIKTAKAKGLSEKDIVIKHAVRNAIMPVITVLGPIAASVLTGAFVVEKVFNIPGMGKFFINSITQNDYTMIAGSALFYGAFLVFATLIVDILYVFIDPRVNFTGGKGD